MYASSKKVSLIVLNCVIAYRVADSVRKGGDPKAIPPAYMPPELIFSNTTSLNEKTDIWALGASVRINFF